MAFVLPPESGLDVFDEFAPPLLVPSPPVDVSPSLVDPAMAPVDPAIAPVVPPDFSEPPHETQHQNNPLATPSVKGFPIGAFTVAALKPNDQ